MGLGLSVLVHLLGVFQLQVADPALYNALLLLTNFTYLLLLGLPLRLKLFLLLATLLALLPGPLRLTLAIILTLLLGRLPSLSLLALVSASLVLPLVSSR